MKGKRKKIIIGAITFAIITIGVIAILKSKESKGIEVTATVFENKNLKQTISITGNIEAADKYEFVIGSTQKVTNIYYKEGDKVKIGDILVKLDTSDLQTQLQKAQVSLDIAKINLDKLLQLNNRSENKLVQNSVTQAQLTLDNAKRNLEDSKNKLASNETLYKSGYISKEYYNSSIKLVSDLENTVKSAELSLENAKSSYADFTVNQSEQIALQKRQIELINADIANINKKIQDSSIKSTVEGIVTKLSLKENQYPTTSNGLIQVCNMSSYKAKVDVSQSDALFVKVGQKVNITVKDSEEKYIGRVSSVGQVADITLNGTNKESKVSVEISIDNPDSEIKVGYEVSANIITNEKSDAFSVNFEAVKADKDGKKYVYIIENGKVKKRYIKTGIETDLDVEILEGLKKGENYVSNPTVDMKEDDAVKISAKK